MQEILHEVARRLPALARLFYRKQDREAGSLHLGDQDVPLVSVTTQILDGAVSETHLASAVGL